jgi:23S rRNA (guanosine2251-2'-O)-methyltransferase
MPKLEKIIGLHAVEAALRNAPEHVESIYFKKSRQDKRLGKIIGLAGQHNILVEQVDDKTLNKKAGSSHHQGVMALYRMATALSESDLFSQLDALEKPAFLLVLDGVTDPHNLGACLRTADAAGVNAIIAPKDKAVGLTPSARKVASGAADSVPFIQVTNLSRTLDKLKAEGIWLVGTSDVAETSLYEQDLTGPIAFVMGAEGKGLRRLTEERCDYLVSLPMLGKVESLNISVATGVCLYEALRQRLS